MYDKGKVLFKEENSSVLIFSDWHIGERSRQGMAWMEK